MNCRECEYCKQYGYTSVQRKAGLRGGRAAYYCEHPRIGTMKDEHGYPLYNFVGYGDGTSKNLLQLKTAKKWCPFKEVEDG